MFVTWLSNARHSWLSVSHLVFDFVHQFRCVTSHGEIFKRSLFLAILWHRFPRSIVNSLSVPCRMRIPAEKIFFTMRVNFLQWIPRNTLRFPRSIAFSSSTFPLLRRPRLTIILLWTIWSWRFHRFPRSIVTRNKISRILISIRGPPRVWWGWRRHERRRSCGQIHHGSWFGCDVLLLILVELVLPSLRCKQ